MCVDSESLQEARTLENLDKSSSGPRPENAFISAGVLRMSGLSCIAVSYTLFLESIGLKFDEIFLVNGFFAFLGASFQAPTGAFADCYGRAKAVKLGTLLLAAGTLAYFFAHDFVTALAIEGLVGLGMAMVTGADEAWLKDRLTERGQGKKLTSIFGRYEATTGLVSVALGVVGGYVGQGDRRLAWLPASGLIFLSLLSVMLWMRDPPQIMGQTTVWSAMRQAWRRIVESAHQTMHDPALRWAAFTGFTICLLLPAFFFWPIFFKMRLGDAWLPLLWIPFFGAKSVGAAVVARSKRLERLSPRGRVLCLVACFLVGAPSLLLMGQLSGWIGPAAALVSLELAFGIFLPMFNGFVHSQITDDKQRATFKSLNSMFFGLGNTLITLVMAWKTHGQKADDKLISLTWRQMGWGMLLAAGLLFLLRPRHVAALPAHNL